MRPPPALRAFTLIELLVSMAVLAILVMLMAQLMSSAARTTTSSGQRLDADSQARLVFDRMADDFANMVNRKDVDFVFRKNTNNDEAYFFSSAPAVTPTNAQPLALVGYRINSNDDKRKNQLERLGLGLQWDSSPSDGPVFLTFAPGQTTAKTDSTLTGSRFQSIIETSSTDAAYHVLGEGVFRLEFSFLLKPTNNQAATIYPSPFRHATNGTINNSTNTNGGLANVQAIIVTLGILDEKGRLFATNTSNNSEDKLTKLAGNLPDAGTTSLAASWHAVITNSNNWAGIPQVAAQQLRIYQRMFPLNMGDN